MASTKRNGKANGNGTPTHVKRAEFARNPGKYLDEALKHGPVLVTDAKGKPRVMLVVAKPAEPYPID